MPDPVSFEIAVERKAKFKVPAVKKRLDEYKSKETTLESIKQKLAKADERRHLRFKPVLKFGEEFEKWLKDIEKRKKHKAEQRKQIKALKENLEQDARQKILAQINEKI